MNIYFLVEGRRTEKKVYPKWLSYLLPELTEVRFAFEATKNNYFIFNGNGYPSLLHNHLKNAIAEVNDLASYNYLVVCLDSDENSTAERVLEVQNFISNNNLSLDSTQLRIIVQNKCIETWFLGNRRVYSRQPQSPELRAYNSFYNVKELDPEKMQYPEDFATSAQFHEAYLSEMLLQKNIRYTKKNPNGVVEKRYLEELIYRNTQTRHIATFGTFIEFCEKVKSEIGEVL
jgi:hypothetical protein